MAQFIELDTSYGVPTRVNVACIMRYFRGARQQTTTVVLMGGTEYEIRQDVAEINIESGMRTKRRSSPKPDRDRPLFSLVTNGYRIPRRQSGATHSCCNRTAEGDRDIAMCFVNQSLER